MGFDDGRVLLHDFGGCAVGDVLDALGLAMADLFPQRLPEHSYASSHSRIPAHDLLEIISEETSVVAIIATDMIAKKAIAERESETIGKRPAARIGRARDHAHGS